MTAISSTDLAGVDYHWNGTLTIEFHSGGIYEYYHVPHSIYARLMEANSHGKFFHAHIKNRFRYRRIE